MLDKASLYMSCIVGLFSLSPLLASALLVINESVACQIMETVAGRLCVRMLVLNKCL